MMIFDTTSPWGTWKPRGIARICLQIIDLLPTGRVFRKLAFLLRKPLTKGDQCFYDREIWGLKLRLTTRGNLTEQRWLTMPKFHDKVECESLVAALYPGAIFLDVGANAGFYTFRALATRHPGLRVVSVEPMESMLERIRYHLALNHLTDSVVLCGCAATPVECEVTLMEDAHNLGESSIRSEGTGRKVMGQPILKILQDHKLPRVDVMKIDIEGMEVAVMEAFFNTAPVALWPRLILAEIKGEAGKPLKDLLISRGYRLVRSTKINGILRLSEESVQ